MRLNPEKKRIYFTELYNQDFNYVYSFILARTAGNSQLTEDIVQDTFASAWISLHRFDQKSSSRTWFCSIAKNKLREYYRRTIYREKFELPGDDGLAEYADSFNLEKVAFDNETRRCVIEVLSEINPLYRYALIMKYMDGLSVKEIAKVLGRSTKAVDGVLQRAKISFEKAYLKMEGCDGKHE
ncbi:RNA polymerase sigma factor [Eubacteriaceae bacterium ES2]|nr:RNA polymerase sigma factor [Eubacteriaceae bacterium ES2]